jgi:hypothetical protein
VCCIDFIAHKTCDVLQKLATQQKLKTQVSRIVSTLFDVENSTCRHFDGVQRSSTTKMENQSRRILGLKQQSRKTSQKNNCDRILYGVGGSAHNTSKASDERPVAAIHHCLFCGTTTEHIQQHWLAKHGHEQAVLAIWLAKSESTRSELIMKLIKFGDEYHESFGVHSVKSIENRNRKFTEVLWKRK